MPTTKRKILVGYARVSTEEQAEEGISLAAQRARMEQYVAMYSEEYVLVDVIVDAGVSAKSLDRPGLRRVFKMLTEGEADGVLVVKLDRLTRKVRDLGSLIDNYFAEGKYVIVSVNERLDATTAGGRLMLNILASVSQWEREAIGERTSDALAHLKESGVQLGRAPLGMEHTDDVDEHGRRVLREIPSERKTVDLIAQLADAGKSLREIAAALDEAGRPTKRGGKWHPETVRLILERREETK